MEPTNIKLLEIKSPEAYLQRRKETLKQFGPLGPADACMLQYFKEGTFLSKKEERCCLWFFQGLNVYPQNLSLLLKDWAHKQSKTNTKDKLVKGMFAVFDVFERQDCVVEINMPGSLKIFRMGDNNKEVLLNDSIDSMYVSSVLRTIYQRNMQWGRYYQLFTSDKPIEQFKGFLQVFFRLVQKSDLYISDEYEQRATIKGSHCCSLVYDMVKRKRIVHHALDFYTDYVKLNTDQFWGCPKLVLLYAELLTLDLKFYKSLRVTTLLAERYNHDPLIVYYQARYLHKLSMNREALKLLQTLKQYNQVDVWLLIADVEIAMARFPDALICLNYIGKLVHPLPKSTTNTLYRQFEQLGKIKKFDPLEDLECFPQLHIEVEEPLVFSEKEKIEPKMRVLPHSVYWRFQPYERQIFDRLLKIKQSIDKAKFQQLIQNTFQTTLKEYPRVNFRTGLSQANIKKPEESQSDEEQDEPNVQVPQFLVDKQERPHQPAISQQPQRNLSIIPQIESFIENSVFEEKKKLELQQHHHHKHILHERLMRLVKAAFHQTPLESAESIRNYNAVLPYYNKLRKALFSNFIYRQMMEIFAETQNYRSVIILIAELLNDLEAFGVRKIDRLPFWVQPYLFDIISQKGLSHVNELIEKLKFYDEAVIDCIKKATTWKLKGADY